MCTLVLYVGFQQPFLWLIITCQWRLEEMKWSWATPTKSDEEYSALRCKNVFMSSSGRVRRSRLQGQNKQQQQHHSNPHPFFTITIIIKPPLLLPLPLPIHPYMLFLCPKIFLPIWQVIDPTLEIIHAAANGRNVKRLAPSKRGWGKLKPILGTT